MAGRAKTPKGKAIHLYDGTGWTCDVECSAEQWALYKRAARRERMKVADWLKKAIESGIASLLAKELAKRAKS